MSLDNNIKNLRNIISSLEGKAAGGGDSYYDTFWDAFQQNGERNYYRYAFANYGWNSDNFKPKYDIVLTSTWATYLFLNATNLNIDLAQRMQELGVKFVFDNFTNAAEMFRNSAITRIGELDFSKITEPYKCFDNMPNLETVDKLIVSETVDVNRSSIGECEALKNITFDGLIGMSVSFRLTTLLTNASIQSIIDHLKDLTGADTQTLTFHADVGAKLTDEQKATASAKNWTLAY